MLLFFRLSECKISDFFSIQQIYPRSFSKLVFTINSKPNRSNRKNDLQKSIREFIIREILHIGNHMKRIMKPRNGLILSNAFQPDENASQTLALPSMLSKKTASYSRTLFSPTETHRKLTHYSLCYPSRCYFLFSFRYMHTKNYYNGFVI